MNLCSDGHDKELGQSNAELKKEIERLKSHLAEAVEGLKWYNTHENWDEDCDVARSVLSKLSKGKPVKKEVGK